MGNSNSLPTGRPKKKMMRPISEMRDESHLFGRNQLIYKLKVGALLVGVTGLSATIVYKNLGFFFPVDPRKKGEKKLTQAIEVTQVAHPKKDVLRPE